MKLTKDTLIEGEIIKRGSQITIVKEGRDFSKADDFYNYNLSLQDLEALIKRFDLGTDAEKNKIMMFLEFALESEDDETLRSHIEQTLFTLRWNH